MIINLLLLGGLFFHGRDIYIKSAESKLIDFRESGISENSLVIVDSRVYRGLIGWLFNDRNYLESSLFSQAVEESNKYGSGQSIETYFVECVSDDCGWGTIAAQPDFNQSMESIVAWFANNTQIVSEMKYGSDIVYRVYKGSMMLNPSILQIAKSTHVINMYPLGYDSSIQEVFDDFEIHTLSDRLMYKSSYFVLRTALWLSFITIIYLIYLFLKE